MNGGSDESKKIMSAMTLFYPVFFCIGKGR